MRPSNTNVTIIVSVIVVVLIAILVWWYVGGGSSPHTIDTGTSPTPAAMGQLQGTVQAPQ